MKDNFEYDLIMKLDGKISEESLVIVLQQLRIFMVDYDIRKRNMSLIPQDTVIPNFYRMYMVAKRVEGLSSKTLITYSFALNDFLHHSNRTIIDLTTNDIRFYLYALSNRSKVCNRTIDQRRLIINSFLGWCKREGYLLNNPCENIKRIKFNEVQRKPLTSMELEMVRDSCNTYKDKALIELFYSTGARVSEIANLKISDINFKTKEVYILGKGNKYRTSYLSAKAELMLKKYFELERKGNSDSVFVLDAKPFTGMKVVGIQTRVRKLGEKAGLERRLHCHLLRHTFASDFLSRGANITDVQRILGHEKLDTTMIYAHISQENVKHDHKKYII